ncbi:MAG: Nif3-like dinuclear metal center hexameric protein, partial [Caldimicrobium sp.]
RDNLNLIITHHPLFYKPINRIFLEDYPGKVISFAIRQNLHLLSWHIPLDKISFGVSEALAKELSFVTKDFIYREGDNYGYGKVVIFENYIRLIDLAKMIKERLKTWVMVVGDPEVKIKKLGICGGAGAFLKNYLMEQGINTLLTSDVKYHQAIEAKEIGFNYLLIDHGIGESFILKILKEKLEEFLQAKEEPIKIKIFQEESPYTKI